MRATRPASQREALAQSVPQVSRLFEPPRYASRTVRALLGPRPAEGALRKNLAETRRRLKGERERNPTPTAGPPAAL